MSGHTSGEWLLLCVTAMVVVFQIIVFKRMFWDAPLKHGLGFFLGVAVPPHFYAGEGVRWLRRYRTVVVTAHSIVALALLLFLVSGRWYLMPVWAGGTAVLFSATLIGFAFYTRRTLGANPPVRASVAIPLETRRLGDYISWRIEALMGVMTVSSWALLLINGDAYVNWGVPVVMTYLIAGLFPFKIGVVRNSFPIPAERPEEHLRLMQAARRYSLFTMDYWRWFVVVLMGGYALLHGWRVVGTNPWSRWALTGATLAVWVFLTLTLIRGERRLSEMGRHLVPIGSWSTPFRPAGLKVPGFTVAFAAWFAGLVLLLVFFRP